MRENRRGSSNRAVVAYRKKHYRGSKKFWEVTVSGNTLTVRLGRTGSAGQEKSKAFATPALAQGEQDKLIAEKQGKGYKEVGPRSSAKDVPPAGAIKPVGPVADLLVRFDNGFPRTVLTTTANSCVALHPY